MPAARQVVAHGPGERGAGHGGRHLTGLVGRVHVHELMVATGPAAGQLRHWRAPVSSALIGTPANASGWGRANPINQ